MSAPVTATLHVEGLLRSSSESVVTGVLGRRPGVVSVDTNAVSQTATVRYDPSLTSVEELSGWVRDCGYHCAGRSVPDHVCDPMTGTSHPAAPVAGHRLSSTPTTDQPPDRSVQRPSARLSTVPGERLVSAARRSRRQHRPGFG